MGKIYNVRLETIQQILKINGGKFFTITSQGLKVNAQLKGKDSFNELGVKFHQVKSKEEFQFPYENISKISCQGVEFIF